MSLQPMALASARSANFDDVFASIKKIDYKGGVTLQVARGADNDEVNFIKTQLDFVKRYW